MAEPKGDDLKRNASLSGEWIGLLRDTLAEGKTQFICRVPPPVFSEHLRKDAVWKKQTQAVWLEKAAHGSIPREL